MGKVFLARPIPEVGIEILKNKGFEIVDSITEADAMLSGLPDKLDKAFFDTAPATLKIIANYAVGYNNIDLDAAKAHNILITNTPDVLTEAVAEHAIALVLSIARRIPEADQHIRTGEWKESWAWDFMLGMELKGKTLGILGPGRIGSRVAEMAGAFGMKAITCGPNDDPDVFLPQCDIVSIHVPLLDSTRHMINADRLAKMKPTAYLVNTSRGPVIDEAALIEALKAKTIAGAALDVFETEPLMSSELFFLDNVVMTPHIASATLEARTNMAIVAATNIIEALEGRTPPNLVK
ncbi:MAG: D-glycerate dehydrogenase [Patescibacteria group bacterium]